MGTVRSRESAKAEKSDDLQSQVDFLYGHTAKVAEVFWDWRHKVMTAFFAAIAGVAVAAAWCYKEPELKGLTFVPLALGVCFSVISHLLDKVNTSVLRECYRLASDYEKQMATGKGIFTAINDIHYHKGTYYGILRIVYLGTAVILALLTVAAFLWLS